MAERLEGFGGTPEQAGRAVALLKSLSIRTAWRSGSVYRTGMPALSWAVAVMQPATGLCAMRSPIMSSVNAVLPAAPNKC